SKSPINQACYVTCSSVQPSFFPAEIVGLRSRRRAMEKKAEAEEQSKRTATQKVLIQIPSYQEVIGGASTSSSSASLFQPSQTFSQAFAFIKNTEFYSPPPKPQPPPPQPPSQSQSPSQNATQSGTSSSSASANQSTSVQSTQTRNSILVSHRQKGNPLLKHIRNVRWTFADVVGDYLIGQSSCALYLSLRYHLLHPDYLYYRIRELQKNYKLRVVLCHVDVEDVTKPLLEVTKTALLHDCTLLCAWSLEECGRYLETIKMYENKPADLIQGQMDTDYLSRSLSGVMDASMEDLARCPGIGERKVKRLHDTFHEPFKRTVSIQPVVPETTTQGLPNEDEATEAEVEKEEEGDSNKRRKKEPEKTVKSALAAAFAKYSAFGKKNDKSHEKTIETPSKSPRSAPEGAKNNSKEGDSS
ncbi:DNA excision repair protein ERCC-1, partial [Linum grandiflorum]